MYITGARHAKNLHPHNPISHPDSYRGSCLPFNLYVKKQLTSILLLLMIGVAATAQDSASVVVSKNRFANLDFGVGYLHTDLGGINRFLSSYGYKPVAEGAVTLSFSPSFFVNRFVFRGEYTWQFPVSVPQSENVRATFTGQHVAASVGYVVLQRPTFRIYPYVGINSFVSQLVVRERRSATNLIDLVNNQQRGFQLLYSNASLDFGIQFDKMIPLKNRRWDCPQNARFMTVGLRVGYLYGPGDVKGRFNGSVIEGAPAYAPNGPYVKLVIGFSTKMRDIKWRK